MDFMTYRHMIGNMVVGIYGQDKTLEVFGYFGV